MSEEKEAPAAEAPKIAIESINAKNLEGVSAADLEQLMGYMASLRAVLMMRMQIVHDAMERAQEIEKAAAKVEKMSLGERLALQQVLGGDHVAKDTAEINQAEGKVKETPTESAP